MNTSMDILGVKYEFGPLVFYSFGPSVKNSVLRFSIYAVLRIRSTVPAQEQNKVKYTKQKGSQEPS